MVPSGFVFLESLPLTSNGKVDRRALPAPSVNGTAEKKVFVAPQTEMEQVIAQIWREVLQTEKVSVHDNFFDLGGTSVHLVRAHARLAALVQQELPIIKMFEHPTIASLVRYMSEPRDRDNVLQQSQKHAQTRRTLRKQQQSRREQGRSSNLVGRQQ
jgi:hypothetical protein